MLGEARFLEAADGQLKDIDQTFVAVGAGFARRGPLLAGTETQWEIGMGQERTARACRFRRSYRSGRRCSSG